MALEIDEVRSYSKWVGMREEWDRLLGKSDEDDVFLTSDWLQTWWQVYGGGRRLSIIIAREQGELVGVAPLMTTKIGKIVKLSVVEFIGTGQSDRLGSFAKEGDVRIHSALWDHVNGMKEWDVLDLRDMREDFASARSVKEAFRAAEFEVSVDLWIPMRGTYKEYLVGLSSSFRHGITRSWAKLDGLAANIDVITEPERMNEGFETLVGLSMRRWNGRGTSTLADVRMRTFLEGAVARLCAKGEVVFHVLNASNEPIAITLGFLHAKRYLYYLSGLNPDYKGFGPGKSLLMKIVQDCYERDLEEMDLLRGGEEYKFKFNPQERHLVRCRYGKGVKASLSEKMGY